MKLISVGEAFALLAWVFDILIVICDWSRKFALPRIAILIDKQIIICYYLDKSDCENNCLD